MAARRAAPPSAIAVGLHLIHDPASAEYGRLGHPERPARVLRSAAHLRDVLPGAVWTAPDPAEPAALARAHSPELLARLHEPGDFDADTPHHEGIAEHAARAAGAALAAARLARDGHPAFSLMRPPGHHATRRKAMGFCYLNHAAIAALQARATGCARVAVWDFDAHHGNGTEDILLGHEGTLLASVHEHPAYPGTGLTGRANIRNYPVPSGLPAADHLEILESSWHDILAFQPELVVVSAGFDAYRGDPLCGLNLEAQDFHRLGSWLRQAPCPSCALLEGGYSEDLPALIEAFLRGWTQP